MLSNVCPKHALCFALMLCGSLLAAVDSQAYVRFGFEQPYFVEELGVQCKDHAIVKHDGIYHVFYIHSFPPEPGDDLRSEKWLGHISSPDLRYWTRHDSILPVAEVPDTWEEKFIWAPKVVRSPTGYYWYLFYTGVDNHVVQQTGLAWSYDLFNWNRWPLNPLYHPGEWADWDDHSWSNCRDPELFRQDEESPWYLLNTASTDDGLGAISLAESINLISFDDQDPLFINDSVNVLESIQLVYENELYHLFFTEATVLHTTHMYSPDFLTGWTKDNATIIDLGHAPEITKLPTETIFSRHDGFDNHEGYRYYYRFDHIDFDTPDNVPEIVSLGGFSDDWSVIFGSAFENQPTWGDNPFNRGEVSSNMEGNSYLATNESFSHPYDGLAGDAQGSQHSGLLASRSFTITGNRISLLVGGGNVPERCFVGLIRNSNGRLVFMETGQDSHAMDLRIWDTSTLIGRTAHFIVADLAYTNEWDHICADSIEEYEETGEDPVPPSNPLSDGPSLEDILTAAGFPSTATPPPAANLPGRLLAPHPNPFNPRTHLRYEIQQAGQVEILVLDSSGRQVRNLFSGHLNAGPGFFIWDGCDNEGRPQPSGCYFARLSVDGTATDSKKMVLIK